MNCPTCNKEHQVQPIDPGKWFLGGPPARESFFCDVCAKRWMVFYHPDRPSPFIISQQDQPEKAKYFEEWMDFVWLEKEQFIKNKSQQMEGEKIRTWLEEQFGIAGMPEVEKGNLEPGTYTNLQIIEKFNKAPMKLVSMLDELKGGSPVSMRSVLSFAADMAQNSQN